MPTYEYRCPEGHDFEQFVMKMSDAKSELPCPHCGLVAARRVSAGAGLLFKGSGFYITDYGKDGKKDQRAAAKAETGVSGDTGAAKKEPAAAGAPATVTPAAGASAKAESKTKSSGTSTSSSSAPKSGPAK